MAVYGLSPDDISSHQQFIDKHRLNFPLLADIDHRVIEAMGLWAEQEWKGQKFMGSLRTTLLINPDGIIKHRWARVQFQGHAEDVLAETKTIMEVE